MASRATHGSRTTIREGGMVPAATKRGRNSMTTFSIIRTSAIVSAIVLALVLILLATGTGPARAVFSGTNGKIAL